MAVILVAPGVRMRVNPAQLALRSPLATRVLAPPAIGSGLAGSTGLAGWWDAATLSGLRSPTGGMLTGWTDAVGTVYDGSGHERTMAPFSAGQGQVAAISMPRLSGLLGGIGAVVQSNTLLAPALAPDLGFRVPDLPMDRAGGWAVYLVWSRPNRRQGSSQDGAPVTLLNAPGLPLIRVSAGDQLLISPLGNGGEFNFPMSRRHTHSILLCHTPNVGLNIWLDDQKIASSINFATSSVALSDIIFLHDGSPLGGAQCWFHEAAIWTGVIPQSQIDMILEHAGRWHRGARQGIVLLINGQSNALNFALNDGAAQLLARGVAWYVGALAHNVLATTGAPANYTMQSGHGIYPAGAYPGSYLNDPGDGSNPATWALGADGSALQTAIAAISAEDRSDICAILWLWSETDSLRQYSELQAFQGAQKRLVGLERTMIGQSAAAVPLCLWNAIPYGTDAGLQMHRKATLITANDPTQNATIVIAQTADSNPRGATWDETTGVASGGDAAHRDSLDNQRFARLATPMIARAIIAAGVSGGVGSLPATVPFRNGPKITHVYLASQDQLVLTIEHDAGTDLRVQRQAASGKGFAVMEGGSPANPGPIVNAVACTRLDATHLAITLQRPLGTAISSYGFYYPYGSTTIGRGNSVTDNYSSISKPAGWDIAIDLGSAWNIDFPLSATFEALPISTTL